MADVRIPIKTAYDGNGFRQVQQDAAKLRRLQERHNQAVLQETKQEIAVKRRLSTLTNKLERDLAREAREQERAAKKRNKALREGTEAVIVAGAAIGAFVVDSVRLADIADNTERSFVGLSGGAEIAAANMAAMERATRDLVSEQEQQQIANQLLGMQIVNNADDLEKLVGGARRLGKEFKGLGAADAANEFALLLSNMSYPRLDAFGLSAGKVRERVNELKDAGKGAEEAFKIAVFEEMDKVLARLGPEVETNTERIQELAAGWTDFQVEFGRAVTAIGDSSGAFDMAGSFLDKLTAGAIAWQGAGEQIALMRRGMELLNDEGETTLGWLEQIPILGDAIRGVDFWGSLIFRTEDLQEAMVEAGSELDIQKRAQEEAAKAAAEATQALQAETEATEDNTEALEEQAKRLERVNDIRRDAARELIDIEEQAAEDIEDIWADYWESEQTGWEDHSDKLTDIKKKAAKEAKKDAQQLEKDLAKVTEDEQKAIEQLKQDAAKEQNYEAKRRQIDALADERLFNFELKQLAAEGAANQIQEALERRAIEEQIAKEKAEVESEIEAEKQQDEIERIKETAAERRAQLREDHAEEATLRDERLAEELAAEEDAYAERVIALREYREEKLAEIEASKQENIEALGRELAEMQELTKAELGQLAKMAGEYGEQFGEALAEGIDKGLETNELVKKLLGNGLTNSSGADNGSQTHPDFEQDFMPGFQFGGLVPGPVGKPQLAIVHGGEEIIPAGQRGNLPPITINASGPGVDQLVAILERKINEGLQDYTDNVLGPALE